MRPIKFRAWDTRKPFSDEPSKEMVYFELTDLDGTYVCPSRTYLEGEYKLMQFTGLLDKNGKEIYEGDIVRIEHWSENPPKDTPLQHEVEVIPVKWVLAGFNIQPNRYLNGDTFEVIGNIYENPELLKV